MSVSCEVIQDLLPLVVDHIASADSEKLVREHMETCDACHSLYLQMIEGEANNAEKETQGNLICRLQKHIFWRELAVLLVGMIPALFLIEQGMLMFYNIILMPFIGMLSYFNLRKKWYYTPIGIFLICFVYETVTLMLDPAGFTPRLAYSFALMGLSMLGVLLGFLLRYAFGKEEGQ